MPPASTRDDVAGVEPAAAPGPLRGLVVVEIAAEEALARVGAARAHQQFTRAAVGQVAVGVVDHAHLQRLGLAPEGARVRQARLVLVGEEAAGLGHAPDLDEGEAEAGLDLRVQARVAAGAQAEAHAVARLPVRARLLEQGRGHDAQVVDGRGA